MDFARERELVHLRYELRRAMADGNPHQAAPLLPTAGLLADPKRAALRHDQAEMAAQHEAGITLIAAMRRDVARLTGASQLISLRTSGTAVAIKSTRVLDMNRKRTTGR